MAIVIVTGAKGQGKTAFAKKFEEQGYHLYDNWEERLTQDSGVAPDKDVHNYMELYSRYSGLPKNRVIVIEEETPELYNTDLNLWQARLKAKKTLFSYADQIYRLTNGKAERLR